jgi:hypothetical protein
MDNEDGSIGGVWGFAALFLGWGFFLIIYGQIFDKLIIAANRFFAMQNGLPQVQDQLNTMSNIVLIFKILPFIFLFGAGLRHWVISLRQQPGYA